MVPISPTERPSGGDRRYSRGKRPRDAEADIAAQIVFGVPVAGGGTGGLWNLNQEPGTATGRTAGLRNLPSYPGSATDDVVSAAGANPSRAVRRRSIVIALIAILDPFPNVAMHVVQAERIGSKSAYWCGSVILPRAVAPAAICFSISDLVAPGIGGARTGARRVLPFGLGEKPIRFASHFREPCHVLLQCQGPAQHRTTCHLSRGRLDCAIRHGRI